MPLQAPNSRVLCSSEYLTWRRYQLLGSITIEIAMQFPDGGPQHIANMGLAASRYGSLALNHTTREAQILRCHALAPPHLAGTASLHTLSIAVDDLFTQQLLLALACQRMGPCRVCNICIRLCTLQDLFHPGLCLCKPDDNLICLFVLFASCADHRSLRSIRNGVLWSSEHHQ